MGDVMDAVPRLHPGAGVQRVGDRWLAVSPDEHLHTFEDEDGQVSEVAEFLIGLIDGQRTVGDIVSRVCEEFDVEPQVGREDTVAFLRLLVDKQVLVLGP